MADFEDIILRFTAQDEEGKKALEEFAALLAAVGQEDANPEVDVKGLGKAELDLGKLVALLKVVDDTKAEPVIRPKTDEGRRAIKLFSDALQEIERFNVDIRPEVDLQPLKDAEEEVTRLQRKLSRQKNSLEKFSGSDQFTRAGGKIRSGKIRETRKELDDALAKVAELKAAASSDFKVTMNTLQARANLDLLRTHLNELAKLVVSPEVNLDDDQAQRTAARIRAVMAEITRLRATAEVDIHTETFQRKMTELRTELKSISADVVRPTIDLQGGEAAEGTIGDVVGLLELLGAMEANPNMDVHGAAAALGDIGAVAIALKELDNQNVDVDIHVKGRIERLGGILGAVKLGFKNAQEAATGFAGSIGRVGVSIGPFAAALGPALIAALALIGGYIVALIGGLAALAASAILAAGAIGALAVALAAALGPAALLGIAFFAGLTKVIQAYQAQQQAKLQKQQQAIQGNQQEVASMRAIADATQALGRAQDDLSQATLDANREMQDSYEAVRDAVRDLAHAELDRDRAQLGIKQAQLNLKKLQDELGLTGNKISDMFKKFTDVDIDFSPKKVAGLLKNVGLDPQDQLDVAGAILDVREAKLREKDATDGVRDSEVNLARAREDNLRFQKLGIKASQRYASALLAVSDAQKALNRALEDKNVAASQSKALALTQQLSKQQRTTLRLINRVMDSLKGGFDFVLSPVWVAFDNILRRIPRFLRKIGPAIARLGAALGGALSAIGSALTSPAAAAAISAFANAMATMAGPIARIIIDVMQILTRVALEALPYLVDFVQKAADAFDRWNAWAQKPGNIAGIIDALVENLKIWLDIAKQLGRIFIGFLISANGPGQDFAKWIRDALKHMADLLLTKKGRKELTDFLDHAWHVARDTAKALADISRLLAAMAPIIDKITPVVVLFLDTLTLGATNLGTAFKIAKTNLAIIWTAWKAYMKAVPGKVIGALWDVIRATVKFRIDLFKAGVHLGVSLAKGIIKGIKDNLNPAGKSPLKNLLWGPLVTGPLKILGIKSPSTVWADMGKNLVLGLEQGITKNVTGLGKLVDASLTIPLVTGPTKAMKNVGKVAPAHQTSTTDQTNNFYITSPAGHAPDEESLISQIDRRLKRLGR